MREIKFREWHQNHMRYWDDIGFFHLYVLNDDKGVFEQYTGLKDKNGVEIYEGDIVSFKSEMVDFKVIAKTVYLNEIAGFAFRTKEIDYKPEDRYEVIGNIHENLELLEVD